MLPGSPGVAVAALVVRNERRADSTRVLLPTEKAIAELKAVALVSINFTDAARPPAKMSSKTILRNIPFSSLAIPMFINHPGECRYRHFSSLKDRRLT
jgi:hypothetical protein